MTLLTQICQRLKELRMSKGLSLEELATRVTRNTGGIHYSSSRICAIEAGRRNITVRTVQDLLQGLECSLEDLVFVPTIDKGRDYRDQINALLLDLENDELAYIMNWIVLYKRFMGGKYENKKKAKVGIIAALITLLLSGCAEQSIMYKGKTVPLSAVSESLANQLHAENPNLDIWVDVQIEVE